MLSIVLLLFQSCIIKTIVYVFATPLCISLDVSMSCWLMKLENQNFLSTGAVHKTLPGATEREVHGQIRAAIKSSKDAQRIADRRSASVVDNWHLLRLMFDVLIGIDFSTISFVLVTLVFCFKHYRYIFG